MDMSYKGWLSVGLKVLGVVTLVNGLVQALVQWGSLTSLQGPAGGWMMASSIALPLVVIGAGLYLLLGTGGLADRVWSDKEEELEWARAMFMVAIKIVGVVLVVQALPDLVRCISEAAYIKTVGNVWNTDAQYHFIYQYLLSSLLKLALGGYLLFKGEGLQGLAFSRAASQDSDPVH